MLSRKWTMDDVEQLRQLLSDNDWNSDVALPIYFSLVPQDDDERRDAEKTTRILIREHEWQKRNENRTRSRLS